MEVNSDIADFSRRDVTLLGKTKPVLLTGATGPAVIVIHEVYGFTQRLRASAAGCAMPGSECTRRSCSAKPFYRSGPLPHYPLEDEAATTLYAASGRLTPLSANSPTGSAVTGS